MQHYVPTIPHHCDECPHPAPTNTGGTRKKGGVLKGAMYATGVAIGMIAGHLIASAYDETHDTVQSCTVERDGVTIVRDTMNAEEFELFCQMLNEE